MAAVAFVVHILHEDRTINPDWWERAARERLRTEPIPIDAGHAPFISRSKELAETLASLSKTYKAH